MDVSSAAIPAVLLAPRRSPAPPFDAAFVAALVPRRPLEGDAVPYCPLEGPSVWAPSDLDPAAYTVHLAPQHIAELEAAVATVLSGGAVRAVGNDLVGLSSVSLDSLSLPTLGPLLAAVGDELSGGRGFALLHRLPVERWSRAQVLVAYWILGLHWGVPMPQNERRHMIGHVKDVGVDPDLKNPSTRIYMTRAAQPWHVDSSDAVALLCLAEAKEGGVTSWASSGAVLNALRAEDPSLLEALAGDWWMDRKGEVAGGEDPVFSMPILNYHKGRALVAMHDSYYQVAALKYGGAAALTKRQSRALEAFNRAADALAVSARLVPGEVQVLNNHALVHKRSAYRDWEDASGQQRHLLRLWLASPPPLAVPLPECYRHLWRGFAADDRGLARRDGSNGGNGRGGGPAGGWGFPEGRVPLEAEVGQAHIPRTQVQAAQ